MSQLKTAFQSKMLWRNWILIGLAEVTLNTIALFTLGANFVKIFFLALWIGFLALSVYKFLTLKSNL